VIRWSSQANVPAGPAWAGASAAAKPWCGSPLASVRRTRRRHLGKVAAGRWIDVARHRPGPPVGGAEPQHRVDDEDRNRRVLEQRRDGVLVAAGSCGAHEVRQLIRGSVAHSISVSTRRR
jgi:hypothetical protein